MTPSGSAIRAPKATSSSVPRSELKIPPLTRPCGLSTTKPKLNAAAPRVATPTHTITSTTIANAAAAVAPTCTNRLTAARRRRLPDGVSGAIGSNGMPSYGAVSDTALI